MVTCTCPVKHFSPPYLRRVGAITLCARVPCLKAERYCIRVKLYLSDRDDARDICRLALLHGGMMIREFCFAYANREQWLAALKSLCLRFSAEYFEPVDATEIPLEKEP